MIAYFDRFSSGNSSAGGLPVPAAPSLNTSTTVVDGSSIVPFCATAQLPNEIPFRFFESGRTATSVYMRGLSEHFTLKPNSGTEWQWRRICFTFRGSAVRIPAYGYGVQPSLNASGPQRLLQNINNGSATDPNPSAAIVALRQRLFKGEIGQDWSDYFLAHVDTRRVDLKYDKTRYLRSGNQQPTSFNFKMWHPMNKTLVYDDDENGAVESTSPFSVQDKRGMGDYYVVDFFRSVGGSNQDQLYVDTNSCLYWHER